MIAKNPLPRRRCTISRQTLAAYTASLTIMAAAQWTSYIAPIIVKINNNETSFSVTDEEQSWIVSIMDFGNILSPIPAGLFMDYYGRKPALMVCSAINLLASIIVICSTHGYHLFFARLLAGIGKGISFTVSPIYVGEIACKETRGALSTAFFTFFCSGSMITFCVTPYLSFTAINWLTLALPLTVLLAFIWIPDSSYYYIMKGQDENVIRSITWFRNTCPKSEQELKNEIAEMKLSISRDLEMKGNFGKLFSIRPHRLAFTILVITHGAQRLSGISYFLSYGTVDLPDSGHPFGPYECFAVFSIIATLSTLVAKYLVDTCGRKKILLISSITTGAVLTTSGFYYVMYESNRKLIEYFWIPYAAVLIFSFTHTLGLGSVPAILQGELFPANMKRYASASVIIISSVISFVINKVCLLIEEIFGIAGMHFLSAITCAIFAVYAYFCIFETKKKSFIEIQKILNNESNEDIFSGP